MKLAMKEVSCGCSQLRLTQWWPARLSRLFQILRRSLTPSRERIVESPVD